MNDAGSSDDGSLVGLRLLGLNGNQVHEFWPRPGASRQNTFSLNPNDYPLDGHRALQLGFGFEASDITSVPTEYGHHLFAISDDPQPEYLVKVSPDLEVTYYPLSDDIHLAEALVYHSGRQSLLVLDEVSSSSSGSPRLFEFALDRRGNPIIDNDQVRLIGVQSIPFEHSVHSHHGYESLALSPDGSRLFIGEVETGVVYEFNLINGLLTKQTRSIQTGVNDLSGLSTFSDDDNNFVLATLHGSSASVDGVMNGDGWAYIQFLDPSSGNQIAEQFVQGDFRSLEGFVLNEDRSVLKPHDLYFVSDGGSSDHGLLVGVDGHDPYESLFDPFSTERQSFSVLLKGVIDEGQEIIQQFDFFLNHPPTDIFVSHTGFSDVHPVNTPVAYFSANDNDINDSIQFELVSDALITDDNFSFFETQLLHNSSFRLDGNALTLLELPSDSGLDKYVVRVKATDQGGLSIIRDFTFDVIPSPGKIFLSNDSIKETDSLNNFVGIILTDSISGDHDVVFSLVDGTDSSDNDSFSINGNQLILNSAVDFESKSSYDLRIQSSFSDGSAFEQSFEVSVEDVYEPPNLVLLSESSIDEGIDAGTVVAQLKAEDPDVDDQIQFSLPRLFLSSTDNDQFSILDDKLIINSTPDFESKQEYSLLIRATDRFGLYSDHNFTLAVNDLNESPTEVFVTSFKFDESLPGGSTVAQLSSNDPDLLDSISFSFVADPDLDQSSFRIDGDRLNILSTPDFESKSTYQLHLRATDQNGLSADTQIELHVNDVNESPNSYYQFF